MILGMTKLLERLALTLQPSDFCTVTWAAEHLGCSERTVLRYVEARMLDVTHPRVGPRESRRTKLMLQVGQVERLREAREAVRRG